MRQGRFSNEEPKPIDALRSVVLGTAAGALMCIVCFIIFALLFVFAKTIPLTMIQPLVMLACALGAFVGGYVTIRLFRMQGMLFGILSGLLLFVLVWIVSAIAIREPLTLQALIKALLMILMGAVGGILGVNKKSHRR